MSRLSYFTARPSRIITAAAVLAMGGLAIGGTAAGFTSSSTTEANVFASGVLQHSNSAENQAVFNVSLMKPGEVKTGEITIKNTGDIGGQFSFSRDKVADTPGPYGGELSKKLNMKVVSDEGVTLYDGKVGAMPTLDFGSYGAGVSHKYTVTVSFPDGGPSPTNTTGDNAFQGSALSASYTIGQVQ